MNTLKKIVVGTVLGTVAMLATATPANADSIVGAGVSNMAARIAGLVAADVAAEMRAALKLPRMYVKRHSPSVVVAAIEAIETIGIETMVVEATRLPETVAMATMIVEATRLPQEEIVVAATRLPARGTTLVANSAF